jgi:hypothetical protein
MSVRIRECKECGKRFEDRNPWYKNFLYHGYGHFCSSRCEELYIEQKKKNLLKFEESKKKKKLGKKTVGLGAIMGIIGIILIFVGIGSYPIGLGLSLIGVLLICFSITILSRGKCVGCFGGC